MIGTVAFGAALNSAIARAKALPEAVWYVLGSIVIFAALIIGIKVLDHLDDQAAVDDYKAQVEAKASDARERSAEDRAQDAVNNLIAEQEREAAIAKAEASEGAKAPEQRAALSPQELALNCARLKQAKLTDSPAYKELCR